MSSESRDEILEALIREGNRLGGRLALSHQGAAEALGLNVTDLLCLELIGGEQSVTAGRLAELLHLTTGAVTGVLDRLERGGFVHRERDPGDRRRVLVRLSPDRERDVTRLLDPLAGALADVTAGYSDAQVRLALDFVTRLSPALAEETARMRSGDARGEGGDVRTLPLGGVRAARLDVDGGLIDVVIEGGLGADELVRAQFSERPPVLARSGDTVTVRPGRTTLFRRYTGAGRLSLNGSVRWSIAVRGGMSNVTLDLCALDLTGLDVRSGMSRVDLSLPAPSGTVAVAVTGGASRLDVRRPEGVPIRVELQGGASKFKVDTSEFGAVGGPVNWQTPDFEAAADRYTLTFRGGADRLTIRSATT